MRSLSGRWGRVLIDQSSTVVNALSVAATGGSIVQVCIGVRSLITGDRNGSTQQDELLLELDTKAAAALAERLLTVALGIEKGKACGPHEPEVAGCDHGHNCGFCRADRDRMLRYHTALRNIADRWDDDSKHSAQHAPYCDAVVCVAKRVLAGGKV
jgi:hypothetical protein